MKRHVRFVERKYQEVYEQPSIEIEAVKLFLQPCVNNPTIVEGQIFLSV